MLQKNRLQAEAGGWQEEGESEIMTSPFNSIEGISPPNSGDRSFIALHHSHGLPSRSMKCFGLHPYCLRVKGNPHLLRVHFPLLEPRDHRMHSLPPATPRQTLLGQTPRRGAEHSENGSTVSRAALHERRKTTSHRCGEVGHMWGPAQGKSWPTPSPRDFGSNSAVS